MGTFIGHLLPGAGFLMIGIWHLYNTMKNYAKSPYNFRTMTWFPVNSSSGRIRCVELITIMAGSLMSIAAELFIGPAKHQPLDTDFTIPTHHLNNFEHSTISMFLLLYASFALYLDTRQHRLPSGSLHALVSCAFMVELLLFHLHSADHMGVEGQYHWLLQLVAMVTLLSVMLEIKYPTSFILAVTRCTSLVMQGIWFIQMAFVLWIKPFVPKGCAMHRIDGHDVVKCASHEWDMRAKALANLQFCWYFAAVLGLVVLMYGKVIGWNQEYVVMMEDTREDLELGCSPVKRHEHARADSIDMDGGCSQSSEEAESMQLSSFSWSDSNSSVGVRDCLRGPVICNSCPPLFFLL